MRKIITLLDSEHAKVGYEFVHYGEAEECKKCNLINVCIENLEKGRKYKVIDLREYEHKCKIYEKVCVVEVEEPETLAAIDSRKAFIGARVLYSSIACSQIFCPNSKYCNPEGLKKGDKCEIRDSLNSLKCEENKDLQVVKLRRV